MYCKNCGKQLNEDEIFCSACGTKNDGAQSFNSVVSQDISVSKKVNL